MIPDPVTQKAAAAGAKKDLSSNTIKARQAPFFSDDLPTNIGTKSSIWPPSVNKVEPMQLQLINIVALR